MSREEALKALLDEKAALYNNKAFLKGDPVQVPHFFTLKEDREISAFFAATLAWGSRVSVIRSSFRLMEMLGGTPYEFITTASPSSFRTLSRFTHRTFNGEDTLYFLESLRNIYLNHGGLEELFTRGYREGGSVFHALAHFRDLFTGLSCFPRTSRHVADVRSGSAAKRLNLFLRWMVRSDGCGVDLGVWKGIPSSALMLPLDVHTGRTARSLGLLSRKQTDWKAVEEITGILRSFDPEDPVKYDFALFGMGTSGGLGSEPGCSANYADFFAAIQ